MIHLAVMTSEDAQADSRMHFISLILSQAAAPAMDVPRWPGLQTVAVSKPLSVIAQLSSQAYIQYALSVCTPVQVGIQ